MFNSFCNPIDCPWDFPGKNTGADCLFPLQGIFPTQRSNLHLLHCSRILYCWATREVHINTHVYRKRVIIRNWLMWLDKLTSNKIWRLHQQMETQESQCVVQILKWPRICTTLDMSNDVTLRNGKRQSLKLPNCLPCVSRWRHRQNVLSAGQRTCVKKLIKSIERLTKD